MLSIHCPGCAKAYNVPEAMRGKQVTCTGCRREFTVGDVPPEQLGVRPALAPPILPTVEPILTPAAASGRKAGGRGLLLVLLLAGGALTAFAALVVLVGLVGLWLYLGNSPSRPADQDLAVAPAAEVPAAEAPPEDAPWEPKLKPARAPRDLRDLPRPVDGNAVLAAPRQPVKDIHVQPLRVQGILPCICWSSDATSFLAATDKGVVHRVALAGFLEQKRLDVGRKVSWMSDSAEGLLLTLPEEEEVWLLDPDTLGVKRRVAAPGCTRVVSTAKLSVAFTAATVAGPLLVIDLKTGATREYSTEYFRGVGFEHLICSPDGRYVFSAGLGKLHRFNVQGTKLTLGESSAAIASKALAVSVSPDSRYVCLPAPLGNEGNRIARPSAITHIYEADNFKRPAFTLNVAPAGAVGFDPKSGHIVTLTQSHNLLVCDSTGRKQNEYNLSSGIDLRGHQFLAHPDGGKLFAVLSDEIRLVRGSKVSPAWWIDISHSNGDGTPALPGLPEVVGKATGVSVRPVQPPKGTEAIRVTPLQIDVVNQVPGMNWSSDGKAFFYAYTSGLVCRVGVEEMKEEVRVELGRLCNGIAVSAQGVLAVLPHEQEIWLLDAGNLALKKRFPVYQAWQILSAAPLSVAFVASRGESESRGFTVLDLKKGLVLGAAAVKPPGILDAEGPGSVRELARTAFVFRDAEVSPDGRYLFGAGGGCLHRFRVDGPELTYLDSSAPSRRNGWAHVHLSVDGKWVGLLSDSIEKTLPKFTQVFSVEDMKKPAVTLPSMDTLAAFAADPKTSAFYALEERAELIVFDPQGTRKASQRLTRQRAGRQLLVHPDGRKLLAMTGEALFWVELRD